MTIGFSGDLIWQSALALAAGMLLNLTPCVLPAIPVKVRTIVYHAGAAPAQRLVAGLAFVAGSLLFFLGLGILTAALHWTWGSLFQSRVFLVILVGALLGFAAFTFVDARLPVPQFTQALPGRRYLEPFLSGTFSALLASSCTGPFLGGVLAFAIARPPAVIIGLFAAVGLGLALPYLIILLRPSLLRRLPRVGPWSQRVRQGLAFVLLAGAAFFAQSLLPREATRWLWFGWIALLTLWAVYALLADRMWPARLVVAIAVVAGAGTVYAAGLASPARTGPLGWTPLTTHKLAQAASDKRPVLLEFTADWCINCKVLEKTVYADTAVAKAARQNDIIALRADLTRPDKRLEKILRADGGAGLPFAVILDRNGHILKRFSGLFTANSLQKTIRLAGAS